MKVNVIIYAWDGTMFDLEWEGQDLSNLFSQVKNFYEQLDSDYPNPSLTRLEILRMFLLGRKASWEQRKAFSKMPIIGEESK